MIKATSLFQTWVIYGPSGVGKTTLAATAPKPIFADSNKGLLSIAHTPGLQHVDGRDVSKFSDLDYIFDNMSGTGRKDWSKKYETVVFDHFDDIQALILDELGEKRAAKDDRSDPDQIEQRDYGTMGTKLRRYIRKFKALKCHKILICGEKDSRETGRLAPSLIGALQHQLPYMVDHTAYLRLGSKGRRYLHLDPGEDFYAKTRARWLTPEQRKIKIELDNLTTLTDLFALIAAGPKKTTKSGTSTEK